MQLGNRSLSLSALAVACLTTLIMGCGTSPDVQVVDLNKVLDIMDETVTEMEEKNKPGEDAGSDAGASGTVDANEFASVKEDASRNDEFLKLFHKNLNDAKLVTVPIGLSMQDTGAIRGFADPDNNNSQSAGEKMLFEIQVDHEKQRMIASDDQGYHRDRTYRPRMGFFSGYLFGSMMNRQNSYYSGARSSMRPNFNQMKMSPENYHSQAVSKARSTARAARSASRTSSRTRTGSGSFSFGK